MGHARGAAGGNWRRNSRFITQVPICVQANPELMKQSMDMMRGMPAEQLEAAARAAGAPPGFITPELTQQMQEQVLP